MLRPTLIALSIALLIPSLHALIFRLDELYSLLTNLYSPLRSVTAILTLFLSWLIVIFSPCSRCCFKRRHYTIAVITLCTMLIVLKRDLDTNLLLPYSPQHLLHKNRSFTMTNKVVLVTGGNSGVGKGISKTMTKLGATVILACRSEAKCAAAANDINQGNHNNHNNHGNHDNQAAGQAVPMPLDLASFDSIHIFSHLFLQQYDRLDLAFFNAGFAGPPSNGKTHTEEGYELGLGSMHFGHHLLYKRLQDVLFETAKDKKNDVRIIMTSSAASQIPYMARFDESLFDTPPGDLKGEITTVTSQYPRSKLANVLFARHLQHQIIQPKNTITTCSCHIGAVDTSIWTSTNTGSWLARVVNSYTKMSMRTIEEGTRTLLKCALSREKNVLYSGAYLDGMGVVLKDSEMHPPSVNDTLAARLWEVSESVVAEEE
jgi:NAD(P)-dependent dehydrogenase (short-subunit alcohol dehydrogenase family)